jgi:hypothetical protein
METRLIFRNTGTCGELFNQFWELREAGGDDELIIEEPPHLITSSTLISGESADRKVRLSL